MKPYEAATKSFESTPAARETVAELQPMLADLISLSLQAKHAHWNVTGPLFRPLHELFDEIADAARGWSDQVAERMRALGASADGRLAAVASNAGIDELPAGPIADREAIAALVERVGGVAGRIRQKLDRLGALDLLSQDMAIGIAEGLEKQAWMLGAHQA
jgi:starvation-inducible DNA-binding protein